MGSCAGSNRINRGQQVSYCSGQIGSTEGSSWVGGSKKLRNGDKKQNKRIEQSLKQLHECQIEVDKLREELLSKMEQPKKYKNWQLDRIFSECYYKNSMENSELQVLADRVKPLSVKVQIAFDSATDLTRLSTADPNLIDDLRSALQNASNFIQAAQRLPSIPPPKPVITTHMLILQEMVPDLSDSDAL